MDKIELWDAVLGELEITLSKASFTTWFKDTFLISITDTGAEAEIAVPNAFAKEWLEKKFAGEITAALAKHLPRLTSLSFRVITREAAAAPMPPLPAEPRDPGKLEPAQSPSRPGGRPGQEDKPSAPAAPQPAFTSNTLNPKYTFESFVVGNSNRLAHAAAVAVAQSPGTLHNPLFVYGGVGLGKTHLAHAIGHEIISRHPAKSVLYVDCEQFTSEFVQAIRSNAMDKFKKKYRDIDVFLVDDIQFLAAKEGTQEEFFHTFNALHQRGRQIVLTSDRVPKAIQLEERLSSRFGWGLVADIQPPNLEMRVAILRNKAMEKRFAVTDEVVTFLAENARSNIRELEGVLNRLIGWCELNGVSPSLEVAREMVGGFLGKQDLRHITPAQILVAVGSFYNVPVEDIVSSRRTADLVLPRQIAMFLLRRELGLSFPRIGQEMGGKDHTTIMHGVGRIEREKASNEKVQEELSMLKEHLFSVVKA